jgi:DNA polymerase III alpha subunit
VPLRMHSHYSFLDSTLSPEAMVKLAQRHSLPAVALTDTGNLHGAVEFALAARDAGVKTIRGLNCASVLSRCSYMSNRRVAIITSAGSFRGTRSEPRALAMKRP